MKDKTIKIICKSSSEAKVDKLIKDILSRNNIVVFTNTITGVVKKVDVWNKDDMGDFLAFESTGITKYVCPYAEEYVISEEVRNV